MTNLVYGYWSLRERADGRHTEQGDLPDLSADTSQFFDSNFGDEIGGGSVVFFVDGAAAASDASLVSVTGTTELLE